MQWNSQSFSFIICFLSLSYRALGFIWCYSSSDYLGKVLGWIHRVTGMTFSLLLSWIIFITTFIPKILKTGDIPNMLMGWRDLRKLFWFAQALGAFIFEIFQRWGLCSVKSPIILIYQNRSPSISLFGLLFLT